MCKSLIAPLKRQFRGQDGFTLIEFLVVVAIFGILMTAIQMMFTAGMNVMKRENSEMEARRQLYFAAEQMVKAVRNTPVFNITLSYTTLGIYDELRLVSPTGVLTRFYLSGDNLYKEVGGQATVIASQIDTLRFSVICDAGSGVYDSYTASTKKVSDADGTFANHDPTVTGMFVSFERAVVGGTVYIYRRVASYTATTLTLDQDFSGTFTPTTKNYAFGKTIRIYVKNKAISKVQTGSEVTTGVTPRF